MLKNMKILLYTYFYDISLNAIKPNFFNAYNLTFSCSPNLGKSKSKLAQKLAIFFYFMSSCINRIAVFNNLFALIFSQQRDKQNCVHNFLLFKYFLNMLLTIFMENALSKLVKLLQ